MGRSFDLHGKQVILTDEELASVQPRKTRTIDIEAFVDLADVDPTDVAHPYFLVPAGESEGAPDRLLVETMGRSDRIALGRFVLRTKEYLAAIGVRDPALTLTTMFFHDEVRSTRPIPTGGKKPTNEQLDRAVALIEELSTDWDPEHYTDCYRERLRRVIESKRRRKQVEAPQREPGPAPATDLMAALEAALEAALGNVRAGRDLRAQPDGGGEDLARLTREELIEQAKEEGIPRRTKLSKHELIKALAGTGGTAAGG